MDSVEAEDQSGLGIHCGDLISRDRNCVSGSSIRVFTSKETRDYKVNEDGRGSLELSIYYPRGAWRSGAPHRHEVSAQEVRSCRARAEMSSGVVLDPHNSADE